LHEANADVDAKSKKGDTAVSLATAKGHMEIARDLSPASRSTFLSACKNGNSEVVQLWLENGGNVNAKDPKGQTALMLAAWEGHKDVVGRLIEAKVDVDAKDNYGMTALMLAALLGHEEVVGRLIEANADVDAQDKNDWTALMRAARNGHKEVVGRLIEAKADVDAKDKNGDTAVSLATAKGHMEIARLLETTQQLEQERQTHSPELVRFLNFVSLDKYLEHLVRCDYDSVADLKEATLEDLKECGIPPKSRKSMKKALLTYRTATTGTEL
jgi:ankyrin repeat protein